MASLGEMTLKGQGCKRDPILAYDLFTQAMDGKDPKAMVGMAYILSEGLLEDTDADPSTA
jgi:TPR repeat protein